ncbi:hypothetical protein, conserved [Trypanosoma brucei gambiense DAL972]|uniref:Uncharacterized protein n=1 Tax=Trypanosoma brucei gambiense (strain MHOM/CI/86/DAL972) TaxID=679716 RepID=D0A7L8_TRYB9|nr:hypothetical protein, conserved [Trypanosoma brucei gambiense DAL972]CBH17669.1 hypothetical protein, conserved [Trypanosoma brucei gambiense DAL972]|eukprot:XP_011779933.1 hypothetical protein, conserved [Trypanosoma brucei gambiense DAL972]
MSWIGIINRQVASRNAAEIQSVEHVFSSHRLAQNRLLKLQQSLQTLRSDNTALDEKNKELVKQVRALELASAGVISRAGREEQLEANVAQLQEKLQESLKNEKDYYKNECEVKRLTEENANLKEEVKKLKNRETELEEVLLRLANNYKALEEENKIVRPKLNAALAERDRCVRELITAKETMAHMQEKILGYDDELNTMRKKGCVGSSGVGRGEVEVDVSRSSHKKDPVNTCRQEFSVQEAAKLPSSVMFTTEHPHGDRLIHAVCATNGGERIVTGGADRMIRYWDSGSGAALQCHPSDGVPLCIDSVGDRLIVGCTDGVVRIWDTKTQRKAELTGHREKVTAAYLSADQRNAYTASSDRSIRLWDLQSATIQKTLLNPSCCNDLCVAESHLLSAHYNGSICVWDSRGRSGNPDEIKNVHPGGATCVRVVRNNLCVSLGREGAISVRDTRRMDEALFRVERGDISTSTHLARIALSPSGRFCAVGTSRGSLLIVDLDERRVMDAELEAAHQEHVKSVAWAQRGETSVLATISNDKRLVLWN